MTGLRIVLRGSIFVAGYKLKQRLEKQEFQIILVIVRNPTLNQKRGVAVSVAAGNNG
jgi:hypothetical protein